MPQDLGLGEKPVPLTESPHSTEETVQQDEGRFVLLATPQNQVAKPARKTSDQNLHPYNRPLTISDLESCVLLENSAFAENERCSREKLMALNPNPCDHPFSFVDKPHVVLDIPCAASATTLLLGAVKKFQAEARRMLSGRYRTIYFFVYRLSTCGELSLGLFCTATPNSGISAETLRTGNLVETGRKNGAVAVLLAHIVATRSAANVVTDDSMSYPPDWNNTKPSPDSKIGHKENGRTICVHSLGVITGYQGRGLGRILMTAYIQQMNAAGIADRIALIAHDHLVPFYEKLGFKSKGPSKAQFGGGGWIDMILELKPLEARTMYG